MTNKDYSDIINLPHHVSRRHPQMPLESRAAQFSPFAALTGYDAAIDETARETEDMKELTEDRLLMLDQKLMLLRECISRRPKVTVTYFEPDARKEGGAYISRTGIVKKIDDITHSLTLESGEVIAAERIVALEGDVFAAF